MANYTGPKAKEMRRFGMAMTNSPKYVKILKRHPNPPGTSPQGNRRRPKQSEYAKRLIEKQKLRYHLQCARKADDELHEGSGLPPRQQRHDPHADARVPVG